MADDILKRCTQCGEVKPGSLFSPRKQNKDGLYSWCKPCTAAKTREWSAKNKERVAARNKRNYWADPESARASRTAYYRKKTGGGPAKPAQVPVADENGTLTLTCTKCKAKLPLCNFYVRPGGLHRTECKGCVNKRTEAYVAENGERVRAYKKRWHAENFERLSKARRAEYASSAAIREDRRVKAAEWCAKNPEKRAAIAQNYKHRRRAQEEGGISSAELFVWKKAQKKVCHWCGVRCAKNFHIDHIQPLARGGGHIAANLCIACPTCNIKKSARDPIEFAQSLGLLL